MKKLKTYQSGFSLVEVLISIAIVSGVVITLIPSITLTAKTSARLHKKSAELEEIRTSGALFRDLISQTVKIETETETNQNAFTGNAKSMTFVSIESFSNNPSMFRIEFTPNGDLLLKQGPTRADKRTSFPKSYLLMQNLNNARFEYFDSEKNSWRETWNIKKLPTLVRLHIRRKESDDIVIESAPLGTAPFSCQFDPISRVCRAT